MMGLKERQKGRKQNYNVWRMKEETDEEGKGNLEFLWYSCSGRVDENV